MVMSLQCVCSFCGDGIESGGFDPGALIYTTNWDGPESSQQMQQFFCHSRCLRAAFHPSVPLYALEKD
jgi:ribosomal protein L24E